MRRAWEEFETRLSRAGELSDKRRASILALGTPGYSFETKPAKRPKRGTSRIGGCPDLPADTSWPECYGWPLVFLAQLNLSELHAVSPSVLPRRGMLFFFGYFTPDGEAMWIRPAKEEWRVIYTPKHSVRGWHPGVPEMFRLPATRIVPRAHISLPDSALPKLARLRLSADEREAYDQVDEANVNRILGCARACQWPVGASWAEAIETKSQTHEARLKSGQAFQHLLTLRGPSVEPVARDGRIYFGLKARELSAGRFDRAVMVEQGS